MFRLDPNEGYWRTVSFYSYADTGAPEENQLRVNQLRVKYRHLRRSEIKALFTPAEPVTAEGEEPPPAPQLTDEDVCRRLVLAIQDGEGAMALDEALEIPNLQEVISTEYFRSLRELREKNLPMPPATG